jgi:hypothetical protein
LLALPRNAIAVGAFKPAMKTDAVKAPAAKTMFDGKVGLKKAVFSAHCAEGVGFAMTAASVIAGKAKTDINVHAPLTARKRLICIR